MYNRFYVIENRMFETSFLNKIIYNEYKKVIKYNLIIITIKVIINLLTIRTLIVSFSCFLIISQN